MTTQRHRKVVAMRFIAWLLLTALPLGIMSRLPSPAELEEPMTAQAELGRIELERWRADSQNQTTTTTENAQTVALPATTPPPYLGEIGGEPVHTTTTLPDIRCVEWWNAARIAGWPAERIPTLLNSIVWAESRCLPHVDNGHDYGLTQVNWSVWSTLVTDMGLKKDHLYQPELNLRVALMIAQAAEAQGWRWCQPWDSSGSHC